MPRRRGPPGPMRKKEARGRSALGRAISRQVSSRYDNGRALSFRWRAAVTGSTRLLFRRGGRTIRCAGWMRVLPRNGVRQDGRPSDYLSDRKQACSTAQSFADCRVETVRLLVGLCVLDHIGTHRNKPEMPVNSRHRTNTEVGSPNISLWEVRQRASTTHFGEAWSVDQRGLFSAECERSRTLPVRNPLWRNRACREPVVPAVPAR